MIKLSNRRYEMLPEIQKKKDEDRKKEEQRTRKEKVKELEQVTEFPSFIILIYHVYPEN